MNIATPRIEDLAQRLAEITVMVAAPPRPVALP